MRQGARCLHTVQRVPVVQTCLSAPGNVFTSSVINTRVWISFSLEACGYGAEIGFYWLNLIRFWLFPEGEEGRGGVGGNGEICSRLATGAVVSVNIGRLLRCELRTSTN